MTPSPRVNSYLMKKTAEIVLAGCNVILDRGFWTREEREQAADYFAARGACFEWHYIDVDDETWRRNIVERNRRILAGKGGSDFYVDEGLLEKLLPRFEVPEHGEIDVWYKNERK